MPLHRLEHRQTRQTATVAPKHSTMQAMGAGTATSAPIRTMSPTPPTTAVPSNVQNRRVITSITATEEQKLELLAELTTHLLVSLRVIEPHTTQGLTLMRKALPRTPLAILRIATTSQATQRLPTLLREAHLCPLRVLLLSQVTAVEEEMRTLSVTTSSAKL